MLIKVGMKNGNGIQLFEQPGQCCKCQAMLCRSLDVIDGNLVKKCLEMSADVDMAHDNGMKFRECAAQTTPYRTPSVVVNQFFALVKTCCGISSKVGMKNDKTFCEQTGRCMDHRDSHVNNHAAICVGIFA